MLVRVRSGCAGIVEYLEKGRKQGREFERDQIDMRLPLSGNLELLRTVLDMPGDPRCGRCRYLHITLGFAERFSNQGRGAGEIDAATIREVDRVFREKLMVAYETDEFVYYSEAHLPRVTYELQPDGSMVERLPHIHIVIPMRNLADGRYLNPLGYGTANIRYIDAIQEGINHEFGLLSPKNSPRTMGKDPLERHTGLRRPVQEQVRHAVERGVVTNFMQLEEFAKTLGAVRLRRGATDDYLNVRPLGSARGINLKAFGRNYFEKGRARHPESAHEREWLTRAAHEARHITSGNRKAYWNLDDSRRTAMLDQLRERARNRIHAMGEGVPEPIQAEPRRDDILPPGPATPGSRFDANPRRDTQANSALEGLLSRAPAPPTAEQLKRDTNASLILDYAAQFLGIEPAAYSIGVGLDGSPRILHQGKQYNLGDFFTKHLQLEWKEGRRILEGCWYATQARSLPKAAPSLWSTFERQRQELVQQYGLQRAAVRDSWARERSRIRERYRARVSRGRMTHTERALARAERVAAEGLARDRAWGRLHLLRRRPRAEAYREFLRDSAQAGDLLALSELRRVGVSDVTPDRDWISGTGPDRTGFTLPDYHVDATGSVSYSLQGRVAVVDAPRRVWVAQSNPAAYDTALRVAVARYGTLLNVNGGAQFRRGVLEAAKRSGMRLTIGIKGVPALGVVQINRPVPKVRR